MMRRLLPTVCLLTVLALLTAVVPAGALISLAQGQSAVSTVPFDTVDRAPTEESQKNTDVVIEPLEVHTASGESFGYGFSTMNPNNNEAHELGFNWVKVYDVPAEPQPVKVLYRVKADAFDWYNLSAFEWQVRQLAEAYGDNIDAYEIGNEVNTYFEWGQPPNASRYVDVLCTARYAILQVDPTAEIISAGLAPVGRISGVWDGHAGHNVSVQDEREYLKEFLNANGQLCSDAIGYHPMGFRADYDAEPDVDGGTPETDCSDGFCFRGVEKIYEIIQADGLDDLKIWATEVGWIVEPADECIGHPSWQGRYWQIVSAQKQAENLVGAFKYARFHYPWMEALFVFNLDFVTAPYYDECEQMSHYSVYGRPAADALGAMSKVIRSTYLPLVLRSP
jgi:hypothetical protein